MLLGMAIIAVACFVIRVVLLRPPVVLEITSDKSTCVFLDDVCLGETPLYLSRDQLEAALGNRLQESKHPNLDASRAPFGAMLFRYTKQNGDSPILWTPAKDSFPAIDTPVGQAARVELPEFYNSSKDKKTIIRIAESRPANPHKAQLILERLPSDAEEGRAKIVIGASDTTLVKSSCEIGVTVYHLRSPFPVCSIQQVKASEWTATQRGWEVRIPVPKCAHSKYWISGFVREFPARAGSDSLEIEQEFVSQK